MIGYHVYLDEDFDTVLERIKQELQIKGVDNVDPSDGGDFGGYEQRRVLPRRRNGDRNDRLGTV